MGTFMLRFSPLFDDGIAMTYLRHIVTAIFLLCYTCLAYAVPTYKWTDENGRIHYSNAPAPASSAVEVKLPAQAKPDPARLPKSAGLQEPELGSVKDAYKLPPSPEQLEARERDRLRQEKAELVEKRYKKERVEAAEKLKREVIEKCERDRETYCGKGYEEIMRQRHWQNQLEGAMRKNRYSH